MKSSAVLAIIAVAAVGGAVWLVTNKKKVAGKGQRSPAAQAKAAADQAFTNLDRLIQQSQSAPYQGPAQAINWARYDDYVNRYQSFYSGLPFNQQAQMPPPLTPPVQARAAYTTEAQVRGVVDNHTAQVARAWAMVQQQAQAGSASSMTTAPTVMSAAETGAVPMAARQAQMLLVTWRNGIGSWVYPDAATNSIMANLKAKAPVPTTVSDYSSPMAPTIVRQNYATATAWRSSLPAAQQALVSAPPQLPLGFPA